MWVFVSILVGTLLALRWPEVVLVAKPGLQPAFAVTMLLVGTLVEREQVQAFVRTPLRPLIGLGAQYTIMPLVAGAVSLAFEDSVIRTGVVLVGGMPGAMGVNGM